MTWILLLAGLVAAAAVVVMIVALCQSLAVDREDARSLDRNVSARAALRKVVESDP